MTRFKFVVLPIFLLAVLAVVFCKWTLPGALVLAGRAPGCSLYQAIRSDMEDDRQVRLKDEIVKTSRVVEKDPAGYHLWETSRGAFWIPGNSDFSLHFDLAEQQRKIYGEGKNFVRRGDVVLDCGANIGVFTREALAAGAKLVVAVEPAPDNLECLRRNLDPDIRAGRVVIYPKGVWDKEDVLTMRIDPKNSAADTFVIEREGLQESTVKLPLTTIDNLVKELKLDRVDFIKMDIEGAEPRALAGAKATLEQFRPRLAISVYHTPDDRYTVPKIVNATWSGYKQECGYCSRHEYSIFPNVYYFH